VHGPRAGLRGDAGASGGCGGGISISRENEYLIAKFFASAELARVDMIASAQNLER
jgi:hypothetical protein